MIVTLSPCGREASGNVGDQLALEVTQDIVEDVRGPTEFQTYSKREDLTSRLDRVNEADAIVLPGVEISQYATHPQDYRITKDLDDVEPPLVPNGGTYSFYPGDEIELRRQTFGPNTSAFLDRLLRYCPDGVVPVRDTIVGRVMELNGYETVLTGDPGWYDLDMIGTPFHRPDSIDKLVVTAPQAMRYLSQAKELVARLGKEFEDAERILAFHAAPRDVDYDLAATGRQLGWEPEYLSHDTDHLELYRDTDLHVGYRLHGHLAHLRWRRPSVLLAEDSRSVGLTETFGTGGVTAFEPRSMFGFEDLFRRVSRRSIRKLADCMDGTLGCSAVFFLYGKFAASPDPAAVDEAMDFVTTQMERDWPALSQIREVIDDTYENGMRPFMADALPS